MKRVIYLFLLCALILNVTDAEAAKKSKSKKVSTWTEAVIEYKNDFEKQMTKTASQTSKKVSAKQDLVPFSIDITGMDTLALITTDAYDGNNGDYTVWYNPTLITTSGKSIPLYKVDYAYGSTGLGSVMYNKNVKGKGLTVNDKKYSRGLSCHTNGVVVYPVNGEFVRFEAEVAIDGGSKKGSAYFKAANVSPRPAVEKLQALYPEQMNLLRSVANLDVLLLESDGRLERSAAKEAISKLSDKAYFSAQIEEIDAEKDVEVKVAKYLELLVSIQKVINLNVDLAWINIEATRKAFDNMKTIKGFDVAKNQPLMDELNSIMASTDFKKIYSADAETIAAAERALALKKALMFANPLLDSDRIVMVRYNLGGNSHDATAVHLGTQRNNWSNQEEAPRTGFDAEIIELSNLRNKPQVRSIFKAPYTSSVADLKMHWDADRVMFTAIDKDTRWNIWEIKLDGTDHKKLIPIIEEDLEAYDGTYLPDGRFIYTSNIGYQGVPCVSGSTPVGNMVLYNPKDGSHRRITFDQDANWHPTVMHNGKVMYVRWEYTDLMHYYSRFVMSMNPDGTEQKNLFGSGSAFPNSTFDIQPLPGHSTAFISTVSGHHGVIRSGRMIAFDPTKSRKGAEGIMFEALHSDGKIDTIATDRLVDKVWPQFIKPMPLNDTYYLVAAKLSKDDLWGIYLVDIFDNMTCIIKEEGLGFISPILVEKKDTPPVIPDRVNLESKEGTVFIQDIYEGEGLRGVPRGTVKQLRLHSYEYAYLKTVSNHSWQGIQSGWDIKRILGTVPVEEDGSVIFTVPANTPISMQPLDENGAAIQWMRSWMTAQPGETVSCVGCHEDQNEIPVPKRVIASQRKPHAITLPEGGIRSFTYNLEVQPILDRACIACHNGEKAFDLSDTTEERVGNGAKTYAYSKSYLNLHPYVHRQGSEADMAVLKPYEYYVNTSELIRLLKNGHHNVELTDAEWRKLYNWIDYNAPYRGDFVANRLKNFPHNESIDQIKRRTELTNKYGCGMGVDWQKEIADYADYLKAQGPITPVMPKSVKKASAKEVKVSGWPFTASEAKSKQAAEGKTTKEVEIAPGVVLKFVRIPAGEFVMGSNKGVDNNRPANKVKIDKAFWMAEVEITNAQYNAIFPYHNSRFVDQLWKDHVTDGYPANLPHQPVIRVSYEDAVKYCKEISEKTGLKVTLPTEAQWEWACRAGSATDFWFGTMNSDFGKKENFADKTTTKMAVKGVNPRPMSSSDTWYKYYNYLPKTEEVNDGSMLQVDSKTYEANPFGLYSMHGNIAEWTRSDFVPYPYTDSPKVSSEYKVVRGGSYIERNKFGTSYVRKAFFPHQKVFNVGIRLIIED